MKQIVISGSMRYLDRMKECASFLNKYGITCILPEEDDWNSIPEDKIDEYKAIVSRQHFDMIAKTNTDAILVVNEDKNGIPNYIGANTFAEIALAFYFRKQIYLMNDIYPPYADELSGWNCIPLMGNLYGILTPVSFN